MKNLYYIEVTDTFSGEANYSWVTRHIIKGTSLRGAVSRFSRLSGINWRFDGIKYVSKSGATCFFIEEYNAEYHADYSLNMDDRE